MLILVSSVKLIAEIALMALAGQWLVGLLAGQKRDQNVFYQLLKLLTRPFTTVVRRITPKAVLDRHVPLATFLLLLVIWFAMVLAKINICVSIGMEACR